MASYMAIHAMSTWEKDECLLHEQNDSSSKGYDGTIGH
jgi:hypothetical protein